MQGDTAESCIGVGVISVASLSPQTSTRQLNNRKEGPLNTYWAGVVSGKDLKASKDGEQRPCWLRGGAAGLGGHLGPQSPVAALPEHRRVLRPQCSHTCAQAGCQRGSGSPVSPIISAPRGIGQRVSAASPMRGQACVSTACSGGCRRLHFNPSFISLFVNTYPAPQVTF